MHFFVKTPGFIALSAVVLALGMPFVNAQGRLSPVKAPPGNVTRPAPNPYLADSLYAVTHFDSSQSDSTPYGPPRGSYMVDLTKQPIAYGGPINIITLASTAENYMWQIGTDRVSYVYMNAGGWETVATYQALAGASSSFPPIPDGNLLAFGASSAVGVNVASMTAFMTQLFGANYAERFGSGAYVLVDKDNVLYAPFGNTLLGIALMDPARPSAGITVRYRLDDAVTAIEGSAPAGVKLSGLSMTYDGHLVVTFSNGVAVIDRDLNLASKVFYRFNDSEFVTNSIAIDENNGIYVASGWSFVPGTTPASMMRKLVWTGTTISDHESDGAWSSPYDNSGSDLAPIIKYGNGTGSTPTLMGFGNDQDQLVVITDGAKQMKLVAFWRNQIPQGFIQRIAGQISVTCGFPSSSLPAWIQSEQSVVVYGYGAFVVNNIPQTVDPTLQSAPKITQVALMGPAYPASYGVQRFQWDTYTHAWSSVWQRSDVSSTSMIPIHSERGNMAVINGYRNGWEVLGLDWDTGAIVHQTNFGNVNFGNGAYAILQYLQNGDLLFNSISGPIRVPYGW